MFPKFLEGCGAEKNRGTEGGELEEPGAVGPLRAGGDGDIIEKRVAHGNA